MQSKILSQIQELETEYAEALGRDVTPEELNRIYNRIKRLRDQLTRDEEDTGPLKDQEKARFDTGLGHD